MMNLFMTILLLFSSLSFAQDCEDGKYFNPTLNRCVIKENIISAKSEAHECANLEGEAYKECFHNNAKESLDKAKSDGEISDSKKPSASYGVPAIVTLGSAYFLFMNKEALQGCSTTSMWLLLGGGVTSFAGELISQHKYRKATKNLVTKYNEKMESSSTDNEKEISNLTQNQMVAYDFQIDQEKARKSAHSTRASTYQMAAGLYTASLVASLYEMYTYGSVEGCAANTVQYTPMDHKLPIAPFMNYFSSEIYYLSEISNLEFIELLTRKAYKGLGINAYASDLSAAQSTAQAAAKTQVKEGVTQAVAEINAQNAASIKNSVAKTLSEKPVFETSPETLGKDLGVKDKINNAVKDARFRAAFAGVLAGYSISVANKAKKEKEKAQKRIDFINKLKEEFALTGGAGFKICSEDDRKKVSMPACYCYLDSGERDPSKANSTTCQNTWNNGDKYGKANDYDFDGQFSDADIKACTTNDAKIDPSCKCKSVKNSKADDACMSISGKLNLGQLGSIKPLTSTMQDATKFVGGQISSSDLKPATTKQMIARLDNLKGQLVKKPDIKKYNDQIKSLEGKLKANFGKTAKRMIASGRATIPSNSLLGNSNSSNDSKTQTPKDLIEKTKNDLGQLKKTKRFFKKNTQSDWDNFDLGSNSGGVEIENQADELAKVMEKDFNFNDISQNKSHNIFKIISNRYQRSGLRRLFDDKGVSQADSSDGKDIHEK